jgi:hypothetical protein
MYKDPHKKYLFLFVVYFLESCLSFFILFASGLLFIQHLYKVRCLTRLCPLSWTSPPNRQQRAKVDFLFFSFKNKNKRKEKVFMDLPIYGGLCVSDAFRRFEPACTGPSVLKSKRLASGRREREKSNGTNVRHLRNQTGNGTAQGRIGQLSQFNSGFERAKRTEKE